MRSDMLEFIFPRVCPVCTRILKGLRRGDNPYICRECYGKISFPDEPRCVKCSRPINDDAGLLCSECSRTERHYDRGVSLMMHDEAARKILYDLKYNNRRDNADMLAAEAADRLADKIMAMDCQVMMPVPLHKKRQFERGFNQAELLAVRTSRALKEKGIDLPVVSDVLKREKNTDPMKTLGASDRRENIRDAFTTVSEKNDMPYRRILLVDDIFTSGVTLSECALVLKRAGAEKVCFLTFSIG